MGEMRSRRGAALLGALVLSAWSGCSRSSPPAYPLAVQADGGANSDAAACMASLGNQDAGQPDVAVAGANDALAAGRQTFRFDTFGDETFWGDKLKLHQAIEGQAHGGVGPGVSPRTALAVGLKVDADAIPVPLAADIKAGKVNLEDPATTLALLQINAVV